MKSPPRHPALLLMHDVEQSMATGPATAPMPPVYQVPKEVRIDGRLYRLVVEEPVRPPKNKPTAIASLTGREIQIVELVAQGLVNKQIADRLQISEWTVGTHLRRIFAKLSVDTRAEMVCRCFSREG